MLPVSSSRPRDGPTPSNSNANTSRSSSSSISVDTAEENGNGFLNRKDLSNGRDDSSKSQSPASSARFTPSAGARVGPVAAEISKYRRREKKGEVVLKYNIDDEGQFSWVNENERVKWQMKILSGEKTSNLKFMFQKSRDVALTMDSQATNLGSIIAKDQSLDVEHNLKASSAEDVAYVGRIRSDGKMTAEGVYFEGALEWSEGHVVSLDLSQLQEYFLFPGQVLALAGRNALGKCVTATKIFAPNSQLFSDRPIEPSEDTSPLNVLIAAGPFTPSDSLDFEPINDFATIIQEVRPDICIVMGPFLDAAHPLLYGPSFPKDETFRTIVRRQIGVLEEAASNASVKLILVSNHKEVHHDFTYPTPPYRIGTTKENERPKNSCVCLPDPALISVGGVIFGLSSTDVLMHLSKSELAKSNGAAGADRMGRLAGHLLTQRNFYPLYPSDESLPLDTERWFEFAQMPIRPHVMVIPSELRYFIKEVDGTVVVNPQHITKGQSGGFYSRLQVQLPAGYESGANSISNFIKADIVKI